jgi:hypothetical protein
MSKECPFFYFSRFDGAAIYSVSTYVHGIRDNLIVLGRKARIPA